MGGPGGNYAEPNGVIREGMMDMSTKSRDTDSRLTELGYAQIFSDAKQVSEEPRGMHFRRTMHLRRRRRMRLKRNSGDPYSVTRFNNVANAWAIYRPV